MPIFTLTLKEMKEVADQTFVLKFNKPADFQFKPGQYGGFTLIDPKEKDAGGITRRFSILSAPDDDYLSILTRIQNSAYKRELKSFLPGQIIKFAGPTGNFVLPSDASIPTVLIAGGVAIAPFYSMIRHTLLNEPKRQITLFYGNQKEKDAAFFKDLQLMSHQYSIFQFVPTLANPPENWEGEAGFITSTMIKKYVADLTKPFFYLCGSPNMVTALQETLIEMEIPEDHIKVEDFPGY